MKDIYLNQTTQASLAKSISNLNDATNALVDEYVLKGLKDYEQVRVNLDSSGFNGLLQIVNATTGQPIVTPNQNNSCLTFTALPNTNYVIRVTGKDGNPTGSYVLNTSSDDTTTASSNNNMTTQVVSTAPNNVTTIAGNSISQSGGSPIGVSSSSTTVISSQSSSAPSASVAPTNSSIALSASTGNLNPTTAAPGKSSLPTPTIALSLPNTPAVPTIGVNSPAIAAPSVTIDPPAQPPTIPAMPPAISIPAVAVTATPATPTIATPTATVTPSSTTAATPAIATPTATVTPSSTTAATPTIATPTATVTPGSTTGATPTIATPTATNPAVGSTTTNIPAIPPSLTIAAPGATTTSTSTNPASTSTNNPTPSSTGSNSGTEIAPSATPATVNIGTNNLLNIQNGGSLQCTPGVSSAAFKNEMGAFVVDDEQGRINGILPGAAGYLAAAMSKAQPIGGNRSIDCPAGSRLGFYLVQDGTTAQIKADLAAGKQPSHPVFFQTGNTDGSEHLKITQSGNNVTFAWEDMMGGGDRDFNDLVINATLPANTSANGANGLGTQQSSANGANLLGAQSVVDLRDISGVKAASVTVGGSSSYDNFIGFYRVDDASGKIGTLNPSDAGYAQAALGRNVILYNKTAGNATPSIDGGGILAPYMIANGTAQSFLANNPTNQGNANLPHAYFGFIGANPDKVQHIQLLGDNKFGFEDTFGGGDRDFNDAIAQIKVTT
jgi:Domain of unknown function (DUF4114)